jgi:dTDP-4-amino-4,6-dideoxygalactose transaminase
MDKKIKLFDPIVGKEEELAILKVLKSRFWASGSGIGNVSKFEQEFKKYVESNDCIAVNSGTAALNLALSLLDIKNKEVILPSLSFVSTAHAVSINGGKPVFVDVDSTTSCIDVEKIKKSITKKTVAILPVHFGGMPCNLKEIMYICKEYNLALIEDAAHAAGAQFNNKRIGSHGMTVCFSFHPVKNLAMPTGGLLSINHNQHKKIRKILLAKRWCGITNRKGADYDVTYVSNNYYMNEFSAAIGLVQLKKLNKLNKIRQGTAKLYNKNINLEKKMPFNKNCSYHYYWILVKDRDNFRKKMLEKGIETGIHYEPIHHFSCYKSKSNLPVTDNIGKQIVTIPTHPNLSRENVHTIIDFVNKFTN